MDGVLEAEERRHGWGGSTPEGWRGRVVLPGLPWTLIRSRPGVVVTALLWWLIPLGAVALTVGVIALLRRPAKPLPDASGDYDQLRKAMSKPLPPTRAGRRSR